MTNILAFLLAVEILALCVGVAAAVGKRPVLSNWMSAVVFMLTATMFALGGTSPHWIVYVLYGIGLCQICTAIFTQVRKVRT